MMGVMDVLCSAIHIVESQKMVVGWVYTMMDAITKDVKKWSEKPLTITLWKEESLKACIAAVNKRWGGEASRCVSARTDVHVFAHVVNPLFFPISKEYPNLIENAVKGYFVHTTKTILKKQMKLLINSTAYCCGKKNLGGKCNRFKMRKKKNFVTMGVSIRRLRG